MHKQELARELAWRMHLGDDTQAQGVANGILNHLFAEDGIIARELAKGGSVVVTGFGTFGTRGHAATTIPNPDGEPISVPSWRGVTFRTGDALRRAVQYDVRVFPVHR